MSVAMSVFLGLCAVSHIMALVYIGYEIELSRAELKAISLEIHRATKNANVQRGRRRGESMH